MGREKKLKQGLENISPLFSKEKSKGGPKPLQKQPSVPPEIPRPVAERKESFPVKPVAVPKAQIQCLGVYSPEAPEDSLFIATYLGSKVASGPQPCTILSLNDGQDAQASNTGPSGLRHLSMSWNEWDQMLEKSSHDVESEAVSAIFFLDMDLKKVPAYPKMASLLDRWILNLQPNLESLKECYKFMKTTLPLNPRAEFCLLIDTPDEERGSAIFEKFSTFVSKWLGIHLVWLGCFSMSQGRPPQVTDQMLEHLFLKSMIFEESLEKRALASATRQLKVAA